MTFHGIEDLILSHAGAWWTYLLMGMLCWIDGFFPPVPSESIVIAMSSLARADTSPVSLLLVAPVAALGAWLGDNTAYAIGRHLPFERVLRGEKGARLHQRAAALIHSRGAVVLVSARFVPGYRIVVNMVAGRVGLPYRRFALIDLWSTALWVAFSVGVGTASGTFFRTSPLVGMGVGVVLGILFGALLERTATWWHDRRAASAHEEDVSAGESR